MDILVLDSTTQSIRAKFSTAISTSQIDFTVHYADVETTTSSLTEGSNLKNTSGESVDTFFSVLSAPSSGYKRVVRNITIYNGDTVSHDVSLSIYNSTSDFVFSKITLGASESWDFSGIDMSYESIRNSIKSYYDSVTTTMTNKTITSPVISTISNSGTLTLPTSTDTLVGRATTDTLTNKRINPRVSTETSSATPTINTDNVDAHNITALATAITSMTTNLSGTPVNFQRLLIRIKDNGTARAITWGSSFEARGVALPTTTVISKVLTVGFIYDTVTSKWGCVASAQEA